MCSDGSSYGSDGRGTLIRIDPDGKKTHDQTGIAAIQNVRALACDGRGRFVGAISRTSSIVVLDPQAKGVFVVRAVELAGGDLLVEVATYQVRASTPKGICILLFHQT